ncbi:MAG: hypothetical protein KAW09_01150, partial [Thermoplasmata archaeon]|nr:hypothetical protein [Thermoplasmata archaeon]
MKNQTAKLLAMGIGFVIALGVLPLVMADDNFDNSTVQVTLTENGYPAIAPSDYHFIPGDTLEVNMQVSGMADTEEDIFDIVICKVGETDHDKCKWFADNVTPDDNGEYHTTVSGDDTLFWSDDAYRVHIGDENYYDSRSIEISQGINWFNFNIQLYTIIAETDRTGYVPGDTVTVFYSIVSIKDGSLITEDAYEDSDFNGQWGVDSADGETKEGPNNFNDASGSFEFDINTDSDPAGDFDIGIWFNGTYGGDREGVEFLSAPWPDFRVDVLDLALSTDRTTYQLESVVKVSVNTIVQWAGPEPDVKVKIAILEGTGVDADEVDNYGGDEFYSDAQGNVFYAFSLDPDDFTEDETYTVRVNITKLGKKAGDEVTFDVKAGGRAISANMMFTKPVYTSGDTIDVEVETAVPAGADTDFTFIYKVKDGTGGTKAQEASSSSFFSYDVPDNFEGSLFFEVEVYNADGDFGSDSEWIEVHYAVILLNAEPQQYESGDTIEAEYTLESILMDNP